jgi:hypothetical protein
MGALPGLIPFGFDRADGGRFGGTESPDLAVIRSTQQTFEETPDSPQMDLGEQATVVHRFDLDYSQAQELAAIYVRGSVWVDSGGRQWRILNVALNYQLGDHCLVTVTSEGINIYLPQPEYQISEVNMNPATQKHPRYAPLNQTFGSMNGSTFVAGTFSPIAEVELAVQQLTSGQGSTSSSALTDLQTLANFITAAYQTGDLIAQEAALELLKKRRRGEDTFYLAGYKVSYATFSPIITSIGNNMPDLDMGGRIEDPTNNSSQVILPPEYWTDSNGNNIFTELAQTLSPQFYANGVSWFRQADNIDYQRTWVRRGSTWIMGPAGGNITLKSNDGTQTTTYVWIGQWDTEIYTPLSTTNPNYPKFDF